MMKSLMVKIVMVLAVAGCSKPATVGEGAGKVTSADIATMKALAVPIRDVSPIILDGKGCYWVLGIGDKTQDLRMLKATDADGKQFCTTIEPEVAAKNVPVSSAAETNASQPVCNTGVTAIGIETCPSGKGEYSKTTYVTPSKDRKTCNSHVFADLSTCK